MTVRLSTGLRNKMLDGGAGGGFKGALNLGKINIYSGPQPVSADSGATGTLLGTVTVDGDGTGLSFGVAIGGAINKAAQNWRFTGLVNGTAGWFRFFPDGGDPAATSETEARIDGSIASSGGDVNLTSTSITVGSPNTIDVFSFTIPPQ
jgi:hypothetical protein